MLMALGLLVVVGCSGVVKEGFIFFDDPRKFHEVTTGGGAAAGAATNAVANAEGQSKLITLGAKLTIYVEEDSTLNQQYIVPNDGIIEYPPLGRITVAAMTTDEVKQKITIGLEKDYFQKATVTVGLEKFAAGVGGGLLYVIGEGGRQGPIAIPSGEEFTCTKLMLAVGSGPFTNLSKVEIMRYVGDKKYKTVVNVKQIMDRGEFEKDIPLINGDWVRVHEKIVNF